MREGRGPFRRLNVKGSHMRKPLVARFLVETAGFGKRHKLLRKVWNRADDTRAPTVWLCCLELLIRCAQCALIGHCGLRLNPRISMCGEPARHSARFVAVRP